MAGEDASAATDEAGDSEDPEGDREGPKDRPPSAPDASSQAGLAPSLFLDFPDPTAVLPHGEEQRALLCGRELDDVVFDVFCASPAPAVAGFAELLALLDVDYGEASGSGGFSITGHSTGVSRRSVSSINPRVIFAQLESGELPLLAATFTRGETFVEVVTRDRTSGELAFYAISFSLRCHQSSAGCLPGDLLTAAVERDWQGVDVYHEEDLKNTTIDCRTCHQPSGPGTPKLLRMQELANPWSHWFYEQTRGGRALLGDYFAAHGGETFASIPGASVSRAHPGLLAAFVRLGGSPVQPNEFLSGEIENEVELSAPEQPEDNRTSGQSATWESMYRAAQRGEAIPAPYHDVKVTDPDKLARMTEAYGRYVRGELSQSALPDIRDVLPDDPTRLAEMGFRVDESLDDAALLTAACALCHNERLDQSLSRARFHTDLERLSREAKDSAIQRLGLPGGDSLAMPPPRFYELGERARGRLVALLRH